MNRRTLPRLSLDLLRGFVAAARHLSFTAAARELCVTQSAVSQEVKALEDQLGTPLFVRVNRGLRLTAAGERLYRASEGALKLIDAAAQDVAGKGSTLAITTTVPLASMWLGPRLAGFARLHPDISLRVVASNDTLDIVRERIDLALRHVPAGQPAPKGVPIFEHYAFPVCSPALLRGSAQALAATPDLASQVLLDLETQSNGRPWYDWQRWLDALGIRDLRPAGALHFSHYDQVVAAAIAGCGVAIGKWPHLASQLRQRTLVAALGPEAVAHLGSFHLVAADDAPPERVDAFARWLRTEAAADESNRSRAMGIARPRTRGRLRTALTPARNAPAQEPR